MKQRNDLKDFSYKRVLIKQKSKKIHIKNNLQHIIWNPKQKIFYLAFLGDQNPLKTLNPESQEIKIPIKTNFNISDMKLSKTKEKLFLLCNFEFLIIFCLQKNKFLKKILVTKNQIVMSFVIADQKERYFFLNSYEGGLYLLDSKHEKKKRVKSNLFQKKTYYNVGLINSKKRVFFLSNYYFHPASYAFKKNYKCNYYYSKMTKFYNTCNCLRKDEIVLFSGNRSGRIVMTDLRSSKLLFSLLMSGQVFIFCLKAKKRSVFCGISSGELVIFKDALGFSIILKIKISDESFFIFCITEKFLLIGGSKKENIKLFKILDSNNLGLDK